jgi:hypothetical protein
VNCCGEDLYYQADKRILGFAGPRGACNASRFLTLQPRGGAAMAFHSIIRHNAVFSSINSSLQVARGQI